MNETRLAARIAHEANRAYCIEMGDYSQPEWDAAPDWQKESAIKGVEGVAAGNGPRESHQSWLDEKVAKGWHHGKVKDIDMKTHPCMVPYDELPRDQKIKDAMFVNVVRAVLSSINTDGED